MGVYEGYSKIKQSVRDMNSVWEQTRQVWTDQKSKQFEEEFVKPLLIETKKAEIVLENISLLLNQVHSEFKD
jgi:hypothetical protein